MLTARSSQSVGYNKFVNGLQRRSTGVLLLIILCSGAIACQSSEQTPTTVPMTTSMLPAEPSTTAASLSTSTPMPLICDLPLPSPQDWPLLICDTFNSDKSVFPDESQDNPYAIYTAATLEGKYEVDYSAKNFAAYSRTVFTWFDIAAAEDFAVSITGQIDTSFQDVSWGIGFRGNENKESFFLFSIFNDGTYAFEIYENDGWVPLISRRPSSSILLDQPNTVTVIAEGMNFRFLINGDSVNFFNGGLLEGTEIFLLVSAREGAKASFTFDDVVVQARAAG